MQRGVKLASMLFALFFMSVACGNPSEAPSSSSLQAKIAAAQAAEDLDEVAALVARARARIGDQAGIPESTGPGYLIPDVPTPSTQQARAAFAPLAREIQRQRWWQIGEDPRQNTKLPRDVASVIVGSVAAYRAGCEERDRSLQLARDAADYLLWTQQQAEVGLIPFPASTAGEGKVFEMARQAVRQIEREGTADQYLRNGWFIEDHTLDAGGLQIDNALGGVALIELYRVTQDQKYLAGALQAAEWAIPRPCVPNWNYNAFSVELLAEAYRETGRPAFLEAAKQKMAIGVLPGQLTDGPHAGRWYDPHNARPNYHYILVRALVRYISVLEENDPTREPALVALRRALPARNGNYLAGGPVPNVASTLDALLVMERLLEDSTQIVGDFQQHAVIDTLARIPIARFRQNQMPVAPGVWGRLLEYWINQ